jgi:hypothetical protein
MSILNGLSKVSANKKNAQQPNLMRVEFFTTNFSRASKDFQSRKISQMNRIWGTE